MSSPTSPACSVQGCVDTADLLVSGPYTPRVFLCPEHARHVRTILVEVLDAYRRPTATHTLGAAGNGSAHLA